MSEYDLRKRCTKALKPWDAKPVENPVWPGTPDLNCSLGWIELKWKARRPRAGTILTLDHFTPQQRVWLSRRHRVGCAYVLLQVEREYLLFEGDVAAVSLGKDTLENLRLFALNQQGTELRNALDRFVEHASHRLRTLLDRSSPQGSKPCCGG